MGKFIGALPRSSVVTYIVVANNYWSFVCWPVSGVLYGTVPWEGGIFLFLEKIQEYPMAWYVPSGRGYF